MACMVTGGFLLYSSEMTHSSVSSSHLKFLQQSTWVLTAENSYAYFIDEEMERQNNTNA